MKAGHIEANSNTQWNLNEKKNYLYFEVSILRIAEKARCLYACKNFIYVTVSYICPSKTAESK